MHLYSYAQHDNHTRGMDTVLPEADTHKIKKKKKTLAVKIKG